MVQLGGDWLLSARYRPSGLIMPVVCCCLLAGICSVDASYSLGISPLQIGHLKGSGEAELCLAFVKVLYCELKHLVQISWANSTPSRHSLQ